jgi:hypothetical protein
MVVMRSLSVSVKQVGSGRIGVQIHQVARRIGRLDVGSPASPIPIPVDRRARM